MSCGMLPLLFAASKGVEACDVTGDQGDNHSRIIRTGET